MEKHDNAELSGVHILVSEGGLREDGTQWRARARLDRKALMPMWRYAERAGVLDTDMSRSALLRSLTAQYERWWNIDVKRFRSKKQFLGYAGRYARRPPPSRSTGSGQSPVLRENGRGQARPVLRGDRSLA